MICLAAAGCARGVNDGPAKQYLFFPPEPVEPRVQFLCSFRGAKDVESPAGWLTKLVLGEDADATAALDKPFGVAVRDGKVYVADTRDPGIVVFDFRNRRYETFGKTGPGRLKMPINIRFAEDGNIYVTDSLREQIIVFDPDGRYVTAYGVPGDFRPVDLILTGDEMYVLDIREHNIKVYDKATRELKRTLGRRGSKPGEFNYPGSLDIDAEGYIYVNDAMNFRIQKIDPNGGALLYFGRAGDTAGCLARPRGIAVDRSGIIYVADAKLHTVLLFNEKGQPLMNFGNPGMEEGDLILPAQIAIDYDGLELFEKYISPDFDAQYLLFVTSQIGNNKVSVFAFGGRKVGTPPKQQ